MRLNFLLAVVIIAALGAGGFFTVNYFRQSNEAKRLEQQSAQAEKAVRDLTASSRSLETEIEKIKIDQASVQDAIAAERLTFAAKPGSNEIIRNVMELGTKTGTSVIPLSASDWAKVKILRSDYEVFRISFKIEGNEQDTIGFVRSLQDLYPTLVIESLRISTPNATQGPDSKTEPAAPPDGKLHADLGIAVYAE